MVETGPLKYRLAGIERRILESQDALAFKAGLSDGHRPSSSEILRRYMMLKTMTDDEIAEAEAQGRHVSDLERDLVDWINALDLATA